MSIFTLLLYAYARIFSETRAINIMHWSKCNRKHQKQVEKARLEMREWSQLQVNYDITDEIIK